MKTPQTLDQKWQHILKDWQTSGLSVMDFCRQRGISNPSFYTWKKRLLLHKRTAVKKPNKFVPVVVESSPANKPAANEVPPERLARYTLESMRALR